MVVAELWFHLGHLFVRPSICLVDPSVVLFPDNTVSKCQWIITTLYMSIDIWEIWFGIANGPIVSIFGSTVSLSLFIFISGQ